jgi:hypothetical protein
MLLNPAAQRTGGIALPSISAACLWLVSVAALRFTQTLGVSNVRQYRTARALLLL